MPGPASRLYAQNIVNLIALMTAKGDDGTAAFAPDFDDEIVSSSCVTRDGVIVHEPTREAIEVYAARPRTASASTSPSDEEAADDDGLQAERAAVQPDDRQPDLPYDQEADQ
jgi:NAD(P) transhydrogenase subunit alpha